MSNEERSDLVSIIERLQKLDSLSPDEFVEFHDSTFGCVIVTEEGASGLYFKCTLHRTQSTVLPQQ